MAHNNQCFEQISFNPFLAENVCFDDNNDPDNNFFNDTDLVNFETPYMFDNEVKNELRNFDPSNSLSLLHVNIRSINTNFENFKYMLDEFNNVFNIICLSETWSTNDDFYNNSNYHLQNYDALHFQRKSVKRGGGLLIYVQKHLNYRVLDNLSISDDDGEFLSIEIINEHSKNFIVSCCYRPPKGNINNFSTHLNMIFDNANSNKKKFFVLGDYNMNCINYEENSDVRNFYNNVFQHGAIPLINKPTRVTTTTATLIDNIITNCFFEKSLKKGIIKSSISDHFPIFVVFDNNKNNTTESKNSKISKRTFNEQNIESFKNDISETNWDVLLNQCSNANKMFETFLKRFLYMYEKNFPIKEHIVKTKDLLTPWMTKGMKKSSKQKQKLYIKYLKRKNEASEIEYKNYKNLFEKLRKKSKQSYYASLIEQHKGNSRKTWQIMKELTGKKKNKSGYLPKMLKSDKGLIFKQEEIANNLNNFFTNVGSNLANKIPNAQKCFKDYLIRNENSINDSDLSFEEFENSFKSLKRNKASGNDNVNSNIIIDTYDVIKQPLFKNFKNSINEGSFPDLLKIAKVSPVFKSGDTSLLGNYRPISILPVFSKILERIMYNRIYSFFENNDLFFDKQFGFQKNTSTEHAILQLTNEISKSFSKKELTLGVFIDLSKAFDTVNHDILLRKLEYYGIRGATKKWLKSYLSNRKQYIIFDKHKKTEYCNITCGVPQGSILGPLLFLIYVNDFHRASTEISTVMFADDTNLFISDKNINQLFSRMNNELIKVSTWFKANKLSLNVTKTKFTLFHPISKKRTIPLILPLLKIDDTHITRDRVTKFLGVLIDENISWKAQIANICSKVSKSIGILYKARHYLSKFLLKQLYSAFIHSYLNYANIAWGSTHRSKLETLYRHQKHAVRVINFKDKFTHSKPLFTEMKILNIYELNIFQVLTFMYRCKLNLSPKIFNSLYTFKPPNKYTLRSKLLIEPVIKSKVEEFSLAFRGPHLWNKIIVVNPTLSVIEKFSLFKKEIKTYIFQFCEAKDYF